MGECVSCVQNILEDNSSEVKNEQIPKAKSMTNSDVNLKDENAAVAIGVNCRTCPRMDCQQRAFPPINKNISGVFSIRTKPQFGSNYIIMPC